MIGWPVFRALSVTDGFDEGYGRISVEIYMNTLLGDSILVLAIN